MVREILPPLHRWDDWEEERGGPLPGPWRMSWCWVPGWKSTGRYRSGSSLGSFWGLPWNQPSLGQAYSDLCRKWHFQAIPIQYWKGTSFFGCAAWHVGSYFLDQGSNPGPLQWNHEVLSTGPPGSSLTSHFSVHCGLPEGTRGAGGGEYSTNYTTWRLLHCPPISVGSSPWPLPRLCPNLRPSGPPHHQLSSSDCLSWVYLRPVQVPFDLSPHLLSCQTYRETLFPRLRQSFSESLGERLWLFKKNNTFFSQGWPLSWMWPDNSVPPKFPAQNSQGDPQPIPVCLGLSQLYSQKPLNPGQTRMLGSPQFLPSRGSQFECCLRDSVKRLGDKTPQLSSLMLGTTASFWPPERPCACWNPRLHSFPWWGPRLTALTPRRLDFRSVLCLLRGVPLIFFFDFTHLDNLDDFYFKRNMLSHFHRWKKSTICHK